MIVFLFGQRSQHLDLTGVHIILKQILLTVLGLKKDLKCFNLFFILTF